MDCYCRGATQRLFKQQTVLRYEYTLHRQMAQPTVYKVNSKIETFNCVGCAATNRKDGRLSENLMIQNDLHLHLTCQHLTGMQLLLLKSRAVFILAQSWSKKRSKSICNLALHIFRFGPLSCIIELPPTLGSGSHNALGGGIYNISHLFPSLSPKSAHSGLLVVPYIQ